MCRFVLGSTWFLLGWNLLHAAEPTVTAEQTEFFENRIRPVLVEQCYRCHSANGKEPKGGLRVDGRAVLLTGGDTGPAIVTGQPEKSLLIEALRYKNVDLAMPPKGKLPAAVLKDFENWVKQGAPWPGDTGKPTPEPGISGFDLQARKQDHWSWQPITPRTPPTVRDSRWPTDPVDRFLLARLEDKKLQPAPDADRLTWLRRVTFTLTGLPPTPAEMAAFQADTSPDAFTIVVDRLLASPHFGERWGRHWLDLVRYAETRGHEFDPNIANAWQYRDYVVRALNQDVPYDAFVREHLAGDTLAQPRLHPTDGFNESILGTGFWHLGEEVHSPVDIRQDQADRLDNRIDVLSKAFLGLTVACARCHDHKFDAISTKDYYALFGLLEGSAYRQVRFDGWADNHAVARELAHLRQETAREVAATWKPSTPPPTPPADPKFDHWLSQGQVVVDYSRLKPNAWLPDDVTFGDGPRPAGSPRFFLQDGKTHLSREPRTAAVFDRFWAGLKRAPESERTFGSLDRRDRAGFTLRTPGFRIERKALYALVRGGGMAYSAVCGHTVVRGPLHGSIVQIFPDAPEYRWVKLPLEGYQGLRAHLELTADPATDFAVALVVQADEPPPAVSHPKMETPEPLPESLRTLAQRVSETERSLAARVRWQSRLAPALFDGNPVDEAVFIRGSPKSPGETVPHRGLEALFGPDALRHAHGSGRHELAVQLTDPVRNPYISRVAVNRIWHHLFGRGLVASTDNFGVLGELPSHPELLDYLAQEFVRDGWSTKRLIRRLVLSRAFRMASTGPEAEADPANLLLHQFRVKRLEGEAIRDAILTANGSLNRTLGGKSIPIYLTPFLDGRGRPKSGPLDGDNRRSLYLAVRRNFLSPFLIAFDTPIPFSTVGRRQVSNVPAQALILLNDPFVHEQTRLWANRILEVPGATPDRIDTVYRAAFGRPATPEEIATCSAFLSGREQDAGAWAELLHTLVNLKEFVFVR